MRVEQVGKNSSFLVRLVQKLGNLSNSLQFPYLISFNLTLDISENPTHPSTSFGLLVYTSISKKALAERAQATPFIPCSMRPSLPRAMRIKSS